jgi:diaminopimelate epimerase
MKPTVRKSSFYKLQASGNDFILIDHRQRTPRKSRQSGTRGRQKPDYKKLAKNLCRRKTGIGADGLLVIEASRKAAFKMRIFNPDGSEAEMCGNGARCVGLWAKYKSPVHQFTRSPVKFETVAGIIEAEANKAGNVKIKTADPLDVKLDSTLSVLGRTIHINYINTGVPHVVIFVEGLDNIDVAKIGRAIRFYKRFAPAGTNVNFVEIRGDNSIAVRTYERGVEAETLACGTGAVASAIIAGSKLNPKSLKYKMEVLTRGGETLKVYFDRRGKKISHVFLEGRAYLTYKGELNM